MAQQNIFLRDEYLGSRPIPDWRTVPGLEVRWHFSYALYYCAQGTFQLGDDYWDRFAAQMYDIMLRAQEKDGGWPLAGGSDGEGGRYYSTSMAILAMSVSYRQLPIYQR